MNTTDGQLPPDDLTHLNAEQRRLKEASEHTTHWKRWGPYLSERAWGTVREDYSPDGSAWNYFPHDQARSRAYRWNEDGIAGICDRHQRVCLAFAFWNGHDAILKERMFGLTGSEGNHGEDVKEYYFYQDSTPTHSYMKCLYKYPQAAFPYEDLVVTNGRRGKHDPEYELLDTGIFNAGRYFDIVVEYAKSTCEDILIQVSISNRGPDAADLHVLPTLWFRDVWTWGYSDPRPVVRRGESNTTASVIESTNDYYGTRYLVCDGTPELIFTENETNTQRLFGVPNRTPYVKDAFHAYVVQGNPEAVNPDQTGTKGAAHYKLTVGAGETKTIRLRYTNGPAVIGDDFETVFAVRRSEADEFYAGIIPHSLSDDAKSVMRQACAGLLWSKQFYHYVIQQWLDGDPAGPPPPESRLEGRNHDWRHVFSADVISMPDTWEYPWFAAWDLAFHCLPLSLVDTDFAKSQLTLLVREWYMHPNGQLPAYEWAFDDVNPPVHAWSAWRVYRIDEKRSGKKDTQFLERVYHKLMLNFTWWVNRKDVEGNNVFQGGFLGLDNIGVFDRNAKLPSGDYLEQSDGTSWMAMYTLNLLAIGLELATINPVYEDVASKFWEHFLYIANAMTNLGNDGVDLWDDQDGFFYDVLHLSSGERIPLKVRSMVGLIPLFAVETLDEDVLNSLPGFKRRFDWFCANRPDLTRNVASMEIPGQGRRRLLSVVNQDQLRRILHVMLDENEFLSPHGIRAISAYHREHPYDLEFDGMDYSVDYEPAESTTELFGGNSNWRGPIWMPMNHLIIESLQKYHYYYNDEFKVECPTGSGNFMNLWDVSVELSRRLTRIFLKDDDGRRPVYGATEVFQTDPHWQDLVLFFEYFHGDNGAGLGASHQTGWTGMVAKLLQQSGEG